MASRAFVEVVADVSQVEGQVETGFERAIRDVENQLPAVEVGAEVDPDAIGRLSRDLANDLRSIESSLEGVDVQTVVSEESVNAVRTRIAQLDSQLQDIDLDVNPEISPIAVERARADLRRLQATLPSIEVEVEVDAPSALSRIRSSLFTPLGAAGREGASIFSDGFSSAMRTPAVGAVIVAGVTAALVTIAPAVAALGIGAAVAMVAFNGFGDAVSAIISGDQKQIDAALQGLSVSARNVANDFLEAWEPIRFLGTQIQESFFQPLTETIPRLTAAFAPLEEPILRVAEAMGGLIDEVLRGLSDEGSVKDFEDILNNTAFIVEKLAPLISDVLSGAISVLAIVLTTGSQSLILFEDAVNGVSGAFTSTVSSVQSFNDRVVQILAGLVVGARDRFNELKTNVSTSVSGLVASAGQQFNSLRDRAGTAFNTLVANARTQANNLRASVSDAFNRAVSATTTALGRLVSEVRSGFNRAVSLARSLPGQILSALAGLGRLLYSSGRSLISGFIDGIRSQIAAVRSAASSIVNAARDYFPFSPAKEGPFSGRGYTTYSGAALVDGFIKGMSSRQAALDAAVNTLLTGRTARQTANGLRRTFISNAPGSAQGMAGGIGLAGRTDTTPNVTVFLGNRFINDYVEAIVTDREASRDRMAAQGMRR